MMVLMMAIDNFIQKISNWELCHSNITYQILTQNTY